MPDLSRTYVLAPRGVGTRGPWPCPGAVLLAVLALCFPVSPACAAEDPPGAAVQAAASRGARAAILEIEMRRGTASELAAYLDPGTAPARPLRRLALTALGRIAPRGGAVEVLREVLALEADPLRAHALWCAGLAMDKALAKPIARHADSAVPEVRAAALAALGWCGDPAHHATLLEGLHAPQAAVRRGALVGLARGGPEGAFERVVVFTQDEDVSVREAAWFAAWRLAARRRKARVSAGNESQTLRSMRAFVGSTPDEGEVASLGRVRVLGLLLPTHLDLASGDVLADAIRPRSVARWMQEAIGRIVPGRQGVAVDRLLDAAVVHDDALVRRAAYEALGTRGGFTDRQRLKTAAAREVDVRLQLVLLAARAACGETVSASSSEAPVGEAPEGESPGGEAPRELQRAARIALLARDDVRRIFPFTDPWSDVAPSDVTVMAAYGALGEAKDHGEAVASWLAGQIASTRLLRERPYALAFALDAATSYPAPPVVEGVLALAGSLGSNARLLPDIERSLASTLGGWCADARLTPALQHACREGLERVAAHAHSAFARAKAREQVKALAAPGPGTHRADAPAGTPDAKTTDEPTERANDWHGLPRPQQPLAAWQLSGKAPWLGEADILRVADWARVHRPVLVFKTSQGTFKCRVDAEAAPVHAVSLILSVHADRYAGTRWHRVVPSFVIQGGDPEGHGAGGGGWTVPDEITPRSYRRGVLGMPKSVKDDGSSQLFFMLSDYLPLDERYTAYGEITDGLDVIDKIRVGDTIESCHIETLVR